MCLRVYYLKELIAATKMKAIQNPMNNQLLSSLSVFRQQISSHFDMDELRQLVFDLEIDWDDLPGATKSVKAQMLIDYMARNGRLPTLQKRLREHRPNVNWPIVDETIAYRIGTNGSTSYLSPQKKRNRTALLKNVEATWIKGFLDQTLEQVVRQELGKQYQPTAVSRSWQMLLQLPDEPQQTIPEKTSVLDIFEQHGRSLLILGAPGSGKTVTLLELARDLIALAHWDDSQPIPVIFNLSSWGQKKPLLKNWLIEQLLLQYQVPHQVSQPWIEKNALTLLLDGLDEVPIAYQNDCIQTINAFRAEYMVDVVVCSRIDAYHTLRTKLNLGIAIILQPLTQNQIKDYLDQHKENTSTLQQLLQKDAALQELARFPLMLNVMILAFNSKGTVNTSIGDDEQSKYDFLFKHYVNRMFTRKAWEKPYNEESAFHWLSWLAGKLQSQNLSIFHLEILQPDWLNAQWQQWAYKISVGLFIVLFFGLMGMGVGFWGQLYDNEETIQKLAALDRPFVGDTIYTLYEQLRLDTISLPITKESLTIDFRRINIKNGLLSGFQIGIFLALLNGWLTSGKMIRAAEYLRWSWSRAAIGVPLTMLIGILGWPLVRFLGEWFGRLFLGDQGETVGLLVGFFSMIIVLISVGIVGKVIVKVLDKQLNNSEQEIVESVFGGLLAGVTIEEITTRIKPNEGIRHSLRNGIKVALAASLATSLFLTVIFLLIINVLIQGNNIPLSPSQWLYIIFWTCFWNGLIVTVGLGSFFWWFFGGRPFLEHTVLRILLHKLGYLPLDLTLFLDDMASRILLYKVGGGYVFVHRYLLEYFASHQSTT